MNTKVRLIPGALLLLGVATAGYWLGTHATPGVQATTSTAKVERKILYYRNPMGLPDTSPAPRKDAMGMDYVAVYEGTDEAAGLVSISTDKVQKLGVKSEAATLRELNKSLRVTGRIEVNERHTYSIAPKFEGWVEKLYVNTTGQAVTKGQPLFDVYSPELVSAQREHALATQGLSSLKDADEDAKTGMRQLADASRARLHNWNITDKQIDSPQDEPRVTFRAPVSGIVLEKKAIEGMRFMPGEMLYQIADLTSLWVIAEVTEQDIRQVQIGRIAKVVVDAYPDRMFDGRMDFIYPTLNSTTRTVRVRMEIKNPQGLLKPAMFANAEIPVGKSGMVLTVPTSAVIDSGKRQVVLVRLAAGRFEPRPVTLGNRSDDYVQVLSGVSEGEQVVTSANFLIDAESNLKAALGGLGEPPAGAPTSSSSEQASTLKGTKAANSNRQQARPEQSRRADSYKAVSVAHQAQGILEAINADGTVSITHEPIKTLGWPGMTMDFVLTNPALAAGIQPGSKINFELVERKPDEWVITKLHAQHEGH